MARAIINDQNINYELAGVIDFRLRTPALMLHGNGENMRIYADVLLKLMTTRGFVLMDSRYQGDSKPLYADKPPRITYDLMADDAIKLMEDELNVGEYDVIGFSDGAITALKMALRSIRIRRLILIGVNSDPSGLKPRAVREIRRELEAARRAKKQVRAELCRMMLEEPNFTRDDLARVICETTVVYGRRDRAINREHSAAIADAIPHGSFIEIRNAGHDIPRTHPGELAELIRSLL